MSTSRPPKPVGSDTQFTFHRHTHERLTGPQGRIRNSSTVKVNYTDKGIFLDASPPGGLGTTLELYKITSLFSDDTHSYDYIGATKWNPNNSNGDGTYGAVQGSEVYVAKCIAGRCPAKEFVDGILITYEYHPSGSSIPFYSDNKRIANADGYSSETHVMHPRYTTNGFDVGNGVMVPNSLILVGKTKTGSGVFDPNGTEINLIEVSPQRFWSYTDQTV